MSLSQLQFSSLVLCYNCFLVNMFECFWHVLIPFLGVNPEKNGESLKKKSSSILFFNAKTLYFRLLYNIVAMQKLHWAWKIEILHNPGHCK